MPHEVILVNAFSLSMIPWERALIGVREASLEEVKKILAKGFETAVGHESTAAFLSRLLGIEVRCERKQVFLWPNTTIIVFQLLSRLPEGRVLTEEELANVKYKFYVVWLEQ
jgi:hypothetical protein